MKKFDFECPKCGEKFSLVEQETKATKSMQRIEELRKAGVDVSNMFAIQGANGGDYIATNKNGKLVIVDNENELLNGIKKHGDIPNNRLFRRFVMAQTFRKLSVYMHTESSLNSIIKRLGYEYQWKMMLDEFYAQYKMFRNEDIICLSERNRWFNRTVANIVAKDYIEHVRNHFDNLPMKHCKGVPYKRIGGKDIFEVDFNQKYMKKLRDARMKIEKSSNPSELYHAVRNFDKLRLRIPFNTEQSHLWVEAYKGAGAFFTMQNMIRFHNCFVYLDGKKLTKNRSLEYLNIKADEFAEERGWCMYGMLKNLILDNNINIDEKIQSWRKK